MVSATESPNTYLVTFTYDETTTTQQEVVCYVRPSFEGIEILYSHHIRRFREVSRGPWEDEGSVKLPLNVQLTSLIRAGVMLELFERLVISIRDVESAMGFNDTTRRVQDLEGKLRKL